MEKQSTTTNKSKHKLLKMLPKAAATAVNFQNPPFSPGRDKINVRSSADVNNRLKSHLNKGFSAPLSIIPIEARNKSKNSSFETPEPTSPKVSCMGQIKHRKKLAKMKHNNNNNNNKDDDVKKKPLGFFNIFSSSAGKRFPGRSKSSVSADTKLSSKRNDDVPRLGQLKRFASGRDSLSNFDWTKAQIAPVEVHHRGFYSDEERGDDEEDGDGDGDEDEEEIIIPFSAPITAGGGVGTRMMSLEPRKEINIWKRRTMAQPRPLRLNTSY